MDSVKTVGDWSLQYTPPPSEWFYSHNASVILCPSAKGGERSILDMRGWGYLTGKGNGALGLDSETAAREQDALALFIIDACKAAASPAGAEVVAREPYNPTTQPFDEPFRHVERDIVHRLTERAALARAEDNATARADARHFEEAATLITSLRDALSDAAYIACLQKDDHSERGWFIVGWQGGRHSIPNNEEQAWLYRRGMVARMAADPRPETEADRWCRNFTEKPDVA